MAATLIPLEMRREHETSSILSLALDQLKRRTQETVRHVAVIELPFGPKGIARAPFARASQQVVICLRGMVRVDWNQYGSRDPLGSQILEDEPKSGHFTGLALGVEDPFRIMNLEEEPSLVLLLSSDPLDGYGTCAAHHFDLEELALELGDPIRVVEARTMASEAVIGNCVHAMRAEEIACLRGLFALTVQEMDLDEHGIVGTRSQPETVFLQPNTGSPYARRVTVRPRFGMALRNYSEEAGYLLTFATRPAMSDDTYKIEIMPVPPAMVLP